MERNDLIDSAKELVNGDRAEVYGDAKINHERIAIGWNVIVDGAIDHEDSWVDKIGYASLGGEMSTGKE